MNQQTIIRIRLATKICNVLVCIALLTVLPVTTIAQDANYMDPEPGTFMQRWLILGPVPAFQDETINKEMDVQEASFEQELLPAEEHDDIKVGKYVKISGKTFQWKYLESGDNIVDLKEHYYGVDYAVAYACADITLQSPEEILFGVGSDDGVKIWLNGKLVHKNWAARPVNPDDDLIMLNMKKGENRLVIKIQQMQGGWGFCCRPLGEEQISEHLFISVREGNPDRIKMFIENGADVNVKNEIGFTPYHLAQIYQREEAAKCLIDFGADTTVKMPAPADPDHIPEYLDKLVPRLMTLYHVPGVSIAGIDNGKIAWDRQYGVLRAGSEQKVDRNTLFEACSMSKPILAYLALKLVEQGKLDLDRPLVQYLDQPYLDDQPLHERITARMVLSHTSGFPNWRPGGWQSGNPLIVESEPGTKFGYSGEGFLYLQRVVEHITGTPYSKYADEALLKPIGMTLSSHEWQDQYSDIATVRHNALGQGQFDPARFDEAVSAYSLYTTPVEYARFIIEILKTDRSAAQSLSAHSLDTMFTRTTNTGWNSLIRSGSAMNEKQWFGLGWAIEETVSGDRISHSGSNGSTYRQMCYTEFDRSNGTGIVIMTNAMGGFPLYREVMALTATP
jgi:CubicO group peptidase (beta-lactamase class C family)